MQSKLFLVDVDGTLFDTERRKVDVRKRFAEKFGEGAVLALQKTYDRVREEDGFVDIKKITKECAHELGINDAASVENIFLELSFKDYLFPGALRFLEDLKNKGRVLIYTWGDDFFQPIKIKKSGIEDVVGSENIIISKDKIKFLPELAEKIKGWGIKRVVFVDNDASFLETAREIFPEAKLVLVKEGKYNI